MSVTLPNPASSAVDALKSALATADSTSLASLARAYGKGTERGAVTLALSAARVASGDKLPRTGAAQRIKSTLALVDAPTATAPDYVAAAATVRAAANATKREADAARKEERAAVAAVWNDRGASMPDRLTAAHDLALMDSLSAVDSRRAALARFESALATARAAGVTYDAALGAIESAFGISEDVAA